MNMMPLDVTQGCNFDYAAFGIAGVTGVEE
jgi:hypothetical protein